MLKKEYGNHLLKFIGQQRNNLYYYCKWKINEIIIYAHN